MKLRNGMAWGGLALVVATAACGDDSDTLGNGGAGGAGGSGPTTSTETGTTSSNASSNASSDASSSDASSSDASSSSGNIEECSSDLPTEITFVIHNDTNARLWFQGSGFGLTQLAAISVDGHPASSCPCDPLTACSSMQASVSADVGFLEPGESFEEVWYGLYFEDDPICEEELSCQPGTTPPMGDLVGTVTGYLIGGQCDEACDCNLSEGGVCNFGDGAETPSDPIDASATFSFPDETTVDVTFTIDG